MQAGHLPLALAIATYDWSIEMALFCVGMHWLPNVDSLLVRAGFAEEDFHCSVTHSVTAAVAVSAAIAGIELCLGSSVHFAIFALAAILVHYMADVVSTVGLTLLWPFSGKKYSLALVDATGYWGRGMFIGYYRQPMAIALELAVSAFLIHRFFEIGVL